MVLGLGSRSKKDKAMVSMELAQLEIHLYEIKPWKMSYYQSKSKFMVLSWSRGEKNIGNSKNLTIDLIRDQRQGERIRVDESFRVSFAPNLDVLKRAKKSLRDQELDCPLVFNLFDCDNMKHPLAQTTLDMLSLTSVMDHKDLAIPFAFSKNVAKGSVAYLHLRVVIHISGSGNAHHGLDEVRKSLSGKSSSPIMSLDQATQEALVAALLSDDDNDNMGIEAFTDDEDDDTRKKDHVSIAEKGVHKASWISSTAQVKQSIQSTVESQGMEAKDSNSSIPRALSTTKAAAIAASTAYSRKHSFVSRNSFIDESYETDPDSAGEDDIFGYNSLEAGSHEKTVAKAKATPTWDNPSSKEKIHLVTGANDMVASISRPKSSADSNSVYEKKMSATEKIVKVEDIPSRHLTISEGTNTSNMAKQAEANPKFLKIDNSKHRLDTKESQLGSTSQTSKVVEDKHQKRNITGFRTNGLPRSSVKQKDAEEAKTQVSSTPDQTKGKTVENAGQDARILTSTIKEIKGKASRSPETGNERDKVDRRMQHLQIEIDDLKGELSDVATIEAAIYLTTAEHSSSSFKLHAPARRFARTYEHTYKRCSQERRASCARNIVSGLVLVARACGNDVPRLTFWWSNTVVLREMISRTFNIFLPKAEISMSTDSQSKKTQSARLFVDANSRQLKQKMPMPVMLNFDWKEPTTFMAALERLEGWIYSKVMESIWWQVLIPQMQQQFSDSSSHVQNNGDAVIEVEEDKQGNISVDIWKKAFLEAYDRLCPVRRLDVKCGCLPMLTKMVLETCVTRVDIAMFNAILRDSETPTDPISDPITDSRVLPIATRTLSFGTGAQLKNAVASLSGWLFAVIIKENDSAILSTLEEDETTRGMFPLLKAVGGLLMLPKDMLMDESVREEVCPVLSLAHVGKILSRFSPDEFSPEPVTTELLDALSSEVGDMNDNVVLAPSLIYSPPDAGLVRHVISDILGGNNKRIVRKGHTSDDEIDELESSISWLLDNTEGLTTRSYTKYNVATNGNIATTISNNGRSNCRFRLLREIWVP